MKGRGSSCLDRCLLLAVCALLASPSVLVAAFTPVRVTFLTDCTKYSHWMSLGMQFSFKMSGQPGKVTRVACCTDAERDSYPQSIKDSVDTWIAPSLAKHPNGDNYPPYNKPEAVIDYLQHNTPEEEYILVLDSDMILRRPFLVEVMQPKKGLAVGAKYAYMIGVNNELALRHVPEIAPRNDTLAGPKGRRGDQVGGFFFIQRDDLKRMSPLWLKYAEDVRFDEMAYNFSGDVYATHPGDRPWISEMYGYAFGAAKADVWHKWDTLSMIYPGYVPHGIPKLMHYGLHWEIQDIHGHNYSFDKHSHFGFNSTTCPPWEAQGEVGIFKQPPRIAELATKDEKNLALYYRDLLAVETIVTVNAGLCDFHLSHCPPSNELYDTCRDAWERYVEVAAESRRLEKMMGCTNSHEKCDEWAKNGECQTNVDFMQTSCLKACNMCKEGEVSGELEGLAPASSDMPTKLASMAKDLGLESSLSTFPTTTSTTTATITTTTGVTTPISTSPTATATATSPASPPPLPPQPTESPPPPALSPPPPAPPPSPTKGFTLPPFDKFQFKARVWPPHAPPPPLPPWNTPLHKNLLVVCYRMALEIDEMKDCMAAAKNNEVYIPQKHASVYRKLKAGDDADQVASALGVSSKSSPPMESLDNLDESLDAMGLAVPQSSLPSLPVLLLEIFGGVAVLALGSRVYWRMRRKIKTVHRNE